MDNLNIDDFFQANIISSMLAASSQSRVRAANSIGLVENVPVEYIEWGVHAIHRTPLFSKRGHKLMDKEPKLLVWNYTLGEKEKLDGLLKEIGAPPASAIDSDQGHLCLREIIHTDGHGQDRLESNEKALLFYNIPQKGVFFLIDIFKKAALPQPIYAIVTEHSIAWPFSKLLEHLVSERDNAAKRGASAGPPTTQQG